MPGQIEGLIGAQQQVPIRFSTHCRRKVLRAIAEERSTGRVRLRSRSAAMALAVSGRVELASWRLRVPRRLK
jgi:hypothetical protein